MATNYYEEYIKNMNKNYEDAYGSQVSAYNSLLENQKQKLASDLTDSNRAVNQDYMNYINPYGVQKEALVNSGLKGSGLEQSNQARAYGSLQSRLGNLKKSNTQALSDLDANAQSNLASLNANYLGNLAGLEGTKLQADQWGQNFAYQQERDKVADTQWQKQFDLTKKNANRSSGGGSSRSSSSSSKSSSGSSSGLTGASSAQSNTDAQVKQRFNGIIQQMAQGKPTESQVDSLVAQMLAAGASDSLANSVYDALLR